MRLTVEQVAAARQGEQMADKLQYIIRSIWQSDPASNNPSTSGRDDRAPNSWSGMLCP